MGVQEVENKTILCWPCFNLSNRIHMCGLFPLARRENDSQVGDRVVTAALRCSTNRKVVVRTYYKRVSASL